MKNIAFIIAIALSDATDKFTGMDWTMDLEGEELAKYEAEVDESVARANEAVEKAYMILMRGNQRELPEALEYAREAYDEEMQWGDAPVYGPIYNALKELIELLED